MLADKASFLYIYIDFNALKQKNNNKTNVLDSTVLDSLLEGFQLISWDWEYLYVNEAVAKHGKSTKEVLLGSTMMEMYPGIEKTDMFKVLEECMTARVSREIENEFEYPDGSKGWFELRVEPVPEGIFILSLDITSRKQAQIELEKLHEELEEKVKTRTKELEKANKDVQVLFKEMHHRVKNNLQIVSSLLSLQAATLSDENLIDVLRKSQERIHTISKVHESLYSKANVSEVNLKDYLSELVSGRIQVYSSTAKCIEGEVKSEDVFCPVEMIVPIGLMINELVTNSLKHGFTNQLEGAIYLEAKGNVKEGIIISYRDNGSGFAPGKLKAENQEGIGHQLIQSLTEQLNAKYKLTSDNTGVNYVIMIPGQAPH